MGARLGDPQVATGLLEIYALADVPSKAAHDVARRLDDYGQDWFQALLRTLSR